MSLERAYANCRRCYELSKKGSWLRISPDSVLCNNAELYLARNEAMKALEKVHKEILLQPEEVALTFYPDSSAGGDLSANVREAMKACAMCCFGRANIAVIVEDIVKGKEIPGIEIPE